MRIVAAGFRQMGDTATTVQFASVSSMSPCYIASAMMKAILVLSLLLAVPAASEKVKPLTPEETRLMIRNLQDTVEEQQERLRIHKQEIDSLRNTVTALESRLSSLEKAAAGRQLSMTSEKQ